MTTLNLARDGAQLIDGPVGAMEVFIDLPRENASCGIAIIGHPQPLLGGSAMHKVPHLLARGLSEAGWLVARPNFRGVGRSVGAHDTGKGETQDVLALHAQLCDALPGARVALVGFSFGAFVQARVAHALAERGQPAWRVCLAGMPYGKVEGQRSYDTPQNLPDALIVHGEQDQCVLLAAVLDWARPQIQPVTVVPGADHYFTGKLHVLRRLVLSHLAA
ncbi:MAG: hypothetical protein JWP79_746 [Polaromonas sp.]|jgi:alpha/beta superfamily hydrolase|nr:hypothetical protein [Polaromonas sp.]MDB5939242.1 hypothetical protein [Polaromonas sp.]